MKLGLFIFFLIGSFYFIKCRELLINPGFEDPDLSAWESWGFGMESETTDVQEGKRAARVTNRTETWQGPAQTLNITNNGRYRYTSYVKQLNDKQGKMFQMIKMTVSYTWADDGKTDYYDIAGRSFLTSSTGWFSLNGDFNAPQRPWSKARLYFQGMDPGINFIVDGSSLQTVAEDTNWISEANSRIERHRKGELTISVSYPSSMNPGDIEIELAHKKHLFGFGSLVHDDYIINSDYAQYQNLFYYMFNWATVGTFKWRYAKGTPDNPDYSFAVNAMNELKKKGMNVRGHNMFWGVPDNVPDWVKGLNGTELDRVVHERIKFITDLTKGQLEHWDVNNELLHGQYFEETTGDPHYSQKMFKSVNQADPYAKLFLNDYDVLAMGTYTDGYVDQALGFEADKTGLGGIGLQSHIRAYTQPDPSLLKQHLDKLALIGLPLWITELDLVIENENARADWYENILRLYFSHPAVHGVIFWGFWDQQSRSPYSALINGHNYYVNEAGKRYLNLIKNEWATNVKQDLTNGPNIKMRAFMGDYDLIVRYQGKAVKHLNFTLALYQDLNIDIPSNPVEVQIPTTPNPFEHTRPKPQISNVNERVVGKSSVKPNAGTNITCMTRWSGFSQIGDDKRVWAGCPDDMILTGCSSLLKNGDWHKDGEEILTEGGEVRCYATNGFRTFGPVQAAARCCKVDNLQCRYKAAGPSDIGVDDRAVFFCENDEYPVGCGSNTWVSSTCGAFPENQTCVAQNDGTEHGVYVTGSCCKAPGMECEVRWSSSSGMLHGAETIVKCQPGWSVMGCSAFSEYGKTAGAFISEYGGEDQCHAFNGGDKFPGEEGVKAVATCCRMK